MKTSLFLWHKREQTTKRVYQQILILNLRISSDFYYQYIPNYFDIRVTTPGPADGSDLKPPS